MPLQDANATPSFGGFRFKSGRKRTELRETILKGLLRCLPVQVAGLDSLWQPCLESHDCLDAVVAAVTGALWLHDRTLFRCPPSESEEYFDPVVLLEGWLYAPSQVACEGRRTNDRQPRVSL